ncbi:hypothetical protein IGI67_002358 [Enterococcus sp. AZ196]
MLRKIASLGNVTVDFLLTGEQNSKNRLLTNIESLTADLKKHDNSILQIQSKIDKLDKERQQEPPVPFNASYLSDLLLLIDPPTTSIQELYDDKIDELIEDRNMEISIRNEIKRSLDIANLTLKQLEAGKIFSIRDRQNPEFEQHGISQQQISGNLKNVPYLLNYESTMKVIELVDSLLKKEENRFNP